MTDQEYDERLGMIADLAARFPSTELTDQNIKGYVWSLGDLSLSTLRAAIEKCINTSKFFPTVAEIRENAEAIATNENEGKHPDSCRCFGTMWIQYQDNGYNQVRRCDAAPDPDDVSMF